MQKFLEQVDVYEAAGKRFFTRAEAEHAEALEAALKTLDFFTVDVCYPMLEGFIPPAKFSVRGRTLHPDSGLECYRYVVASPLEGVSPEDQAYYLESELVEARVKAGYPLVYRQGEVPDVRGVRVRHEGRVTSFDDLYRQLYYTVGDPHVARVSFVLFDDTGAGARVHEAFRTWHTAASRASIPQLHQGSRWGEGDFLSVT